jgi:hypothetical protein
LIVEAATAKFWRQVDQAPHYGKAIFAKLQGHVKAYDSSLLGWSQTLTAGLGFGWTDAAQQTNPRVEISRPSEPCTRAAPHFHGLLK